MVFDPNEIDRQGYVLLPIPFTVYAKNIYKKAIKKEHGVKIADGQSSNITEDAVLISDSLISAQNIINHVQRC